MFYFIPSWYPEDRTWYDNTRIWYRGSMASYFDDSINQMRMFQAAGQDMRLVCLNYMPNLRYFLHRYDLLEVDTFSIFDAIQGIEVEQNQVIDYLDLDWPQGIEFINTPFLVMARLNGELYAQIEFGEEGQMIWIDFFKQGLIHKKLIFDDRGFLSSVIFHSYGQPYYQDYLGLDGCYRLREYLHPENRAVHVHPKLRGHYKQPVYENMGAVIQEVAISYFEKQVRGTLVVAADSRHQEIIQKVKGNHKLILSFFKKRYDRDPLSHQATLVKDSASLVIADRLGTKEVLKSMTGVPVQQISLFDTRLALGKSQRMKEQLIYFVIDHISREEMEKVLLEMFDLMAEQEDVHLALVTYEANPGVIEETEERLEELLASRPEDYLYLEKEEDKHVYEVFGPEKTESRICFKALHSEVDIINELDRARLVLDLAAEPDLYTQIAGISAGIPQINVLETEYVEHLKNGYIIQNRDQVREALEYYLIGLVHWNQALVYSVQKITDYTSGVLVEKMKEALYK
ncbi:TPA: accessory Sec system protein Asp1 [Streptococcus suis]